MHLWTEYEGRTIAGDYTLGKLLRSEGRNGFFATFTASGDSAVIRLTESHYDEEEVLKRWRQVAELHQDHLVEIERVGKTTFDGVPLTYALMERNDANLEDVLKKRPLTTAETIEIAKSIVHALSALHASGLVHEHVEPINVLAVGDVVKLRSDCVRECIADGEFTTEEACEELRRRDVHDLGSLLLRCLTLERELTTAHRLPEPFSRIIPGALEGSWSLAKMQAVLSPTFSTPPAPVAANLPRPAATTPVSPTPANGNANGASARPAVATSPVSAAVPPAHTTRVQPETPLPVRARGYREMDEVAEPAKGPSKNVLLIGLVALVVLGLLCWHLLAGKPAATARTAGVAVPAAQPITPSPLAGGAPAAAGTPAPRAVAHTSAPEPAAPVAAHAAAGWYVIAYTYNHESQARTKAERVAHRHGLHAGVFSPNGRAPYFVSLGGPMSEEAARALQHRARREGMPRDTFVRRY